MDKYTTSSRNVHLRNAEDEDGVGSSGVGGVKDQDEDTDTDSWPRILTRRCRLGPSNAALVQVALDLSATFRWK
jgi:hypothetical protein